MTVEDEDGDINCPFCLNDLLFIQKEFIKKQRVKEAILDNLKCKCESLEYIPSHGIVIGSTCVFCSIKRKIISDLGME